MNRPVCDQSRARSSVLNRKPGQGSFEPEMVCIPAGAFLMGTSTEQIAQLSRQWELAREWKEKGYFRREQPQHTVTLDSYSIGRYPVTVGQFRVFVEAGGYRRRGYWTEAGWAWRLAAGCMQSDYWEARAWDGDAQHPVVGISWYEAYAYCSWLREVTGRAYRLPTEAEWEKAARGPSSGGGQQWPWGDTFDAARCNVRASGWGRTLPVGHFSPAGDSFYGCSEMVGNVSEWTMTRFVAYPYSAGDGRDDPAGEAERVTRGGSWHSPILRARTVSRGMNDPTFKDDDLGFRCACSGPD